MVTNLKSLIIAALPIGHPTTSSSPDKNTKLTNVYLTFGVGGLGAVGDGWWVVGRHHRDW